MSTYHIEHKQVQTLLANVVKASLAGFSCIVVCEREAFLRILRHEFVQRLKGRLRDPHERVRFITADPALFDRETLRSPVHHVDLVFIEPAVFISSYMREI